MGEKNDWENIFIKTYGSFPTTADVIFFYSHTSGSDYLPKIVRISDKVITFELIRGFDGYEYINNNGDILPVICDLSEKLLVDNCEVDVAESIKYEYRFNKTYIHCQDELVKIKNSGIYNKTIAFLFSEIESFYALSVSFWKKCFCDERSYLLHGDLHPGNIIFNQKSKKWVAIDPIVTYAPIEFDYSRFIENMTYPYPYCSFAIQTNDQYRGACDDYIKRINGFIREIIPVINSTSLKMSASLFIDSFLRLMETVIDKKEDEKYYDEIITSLFCCRCLKDLVLVD